jgi:hypothetical protein
MRRLSKTVNRYCFSGRIPPIFWSGIVTLLSVVVWSLLSDVTAREPRDQGSSIIVLEDFSKFETDGFPQGWHTSRNESATRKAYVVKSEQEGPFLRATGIDDQMRIYKKTPTWNPKEYPIVTWRWRLRSVPPDTELLAAVFLSLDQDFIFVPVSTKYTWHARGPVGSLKEGGLFGPAEILIRSGFQPVGQWQVERVNAYEDFKKIHKHEPATRAWGISLVAGRGVEVDFGPIEAGIQP